MKNTAVTISLLGLFVGVFVSAGCSPAHDDASHEKETERVAAEAHPAQVVNAVTRSWQPPSALVSAVELAELVATDATKLKILEPGNSLSSYSQGHLPGAVFVDWVKDMTDPIQVAFYNKPSRSQFATLMGKLGIQNND